MHTTLFYVAAVGACALLATTISGQSARAIAGRHRWSRSRTSRRRG